jgi:hypothetical protein
MRRSKYNTRPSTLSADCAWHGPPIGDTSLCSNSRSPVPSAGAADRGSPQGGVRHTDAPRARNAPGHRLTTGTPRQWAARSRTGPLWPRPPRRAGVCGRRGPRWSSPQAGAGHSGGAGASTLGGGPGGSGSGSVVEIVGPWTWCPTPADACRRLRLLRDGIRWACRLSRAPARTPRGWWRAPGRGR